MINCTDNPKEWNHKLVRYWLVELFCPCIFMWNDFQWVHHLMFNIFFFFYCLAIAFIVIHALEKLPTTTHLFNCMNPIAHCESDRETTHNIDFDNIWRWHSSVAWFFLKLFFLLLIWPIVVCSDLFLFFIRFLCYIGNIDMSSVSMVRNRLRNQKAPIHVKYRRWFERGRSCFAVFFVVFFVTLSSLANWKLLIVWSRLDKSLMTKHDSLWSNWLF